MNLNIVFSLLLIAIQVAGVGFNIRYAFYGQKAKDPGGPIFLVVCLTLTAIFAFAYFRLGVYAPLGWAP